MKKLQSALVALFLCLAGGVAHAQNAFPTPSGGGANVANGHVDMCLNSSNQAVPFGPSCASGIPVQPISSGNLPSTSTAISGTTSGTPSTWTSALATSSSRKGCTIQNNGTQPISIAMGASTPSAADYILAVGQPFNCIDQQQVWVMSAAASQAYSGRPW